MAAFASMRQLRQEIKDTTTQTGPLSDEEGFKLIRETTAKGTKITELTAPINYANLCYANQHDSLTFVEKVFTDRQQELDNHLRIVAQQYLLSSQPL